MKWVDGRISIMLAAESLSIPQTFTHIFDFRKREASANINLGLQSCGSRLPAANLFRFRITAWAKGGPVRIAGIIQIYVAPLWGLYEEPEATRRLDELEYTEHNQ